MTLKGHKNLIPAVATATESPCWRPGVFVSLEMVISNILAILGASNMLRETLRSGNRQGSSTERPFGDYLYKHQ
jgi:hypothetical protein